VETKPAKELATGILLMIIGNFGNGKEYDTLKSNCANANCTAIVEMLTC